MSAEENRLSVDVFWSMRSPYCYISLDRCLELRRRFDFDLNLKVVYPIAIKDPSWFKAAKDMKYRLPYQNVDIFRTAAFHGVQMVYPTPDPVAQKPDPNSPYGEILPFGGLGADLDEGGQPDIKVLVRTAVGAERMGKGWEYLNTVMRLVWNGQKVPWNANNYAHVIDAIAAAGIDADALMDDIKSDRKKYDTWVQENMDLQLTNDCAHAGVPCFVFRGEPFFGQDRMGQLVWRLKQYGLEERPDYEPTLRPSMAPGFWISD